MNRLLTELHRLYRPHAPADTPIPATGRAAEAAAEAGLIDPQGRTRAMVMDVGRPADWDLAARVWRGVQSDLGLPAPAIAVSGTDGYQLWFSMAEPLSLADAHAFLEALRRHYLADIGTRRVAMWPAADASTSAPPDVPAQHAGSDRWSAFVAPDLAALFVDTPWLDVPPSLDGQAELLVHLLSAGREQFDHARAVLARPLATGGTGAPSTGASGHWSEPSSPAPPAPSGVTLAGHTDPRRFLLQVMNDASVPLPLRIEAAKALLPYADPRPDPPVSRTTSPTCGSSAASAP